MRGNGSVPGLDGKWTREMGLLGSPDSQQERVTLYCLNVEWKEGLPLFAELLQVFPNFSELYSLLDLSASIGSELYSLLSLVALSGAG